MTEQEAQPQEHPGSQAHQSLDEYWATAGASDPELIAYVASPELSGAPGWPNIRQAFRIVRTPTTVIIASDGLSSVDPDNPSVGPGLGCEVFLETPELTGAEFGEIQRSWQFSILEQFARKVADLGGIGATLSTHTVLPVELRATGNTPQALLTGRNTLGALIGIPVQGRAAQAITAAGRVNIVPLTVISPDELESAFAEGGRVGVAKRRMIKGAGHLSVTAV